MKQKKPVKKLLEYDAPNKATVLGRRKNGYVRARVRVCKPGVSEYYLPSEGRFERRLRLPEEVFKGTSLDTYTLAPVTDEHPGVLDSQNTRYFARGSIGPAKKVGDYVEAEIQITDEDLIEKINNRDSVQVSPCYTFRRIEKPGVWNGQRYDVICKDIEVNHIAVTAKGRQGEDIALIMDSAKDSPGIAFEVTPELRKQLNEDSQDKRGNTVKIKIGGRTVDVDDGVAELIETERRDVKEQTSALQTSLDSANDALKEAAKKLEAATDPKAFHAKVNERVALVANARKVLGNKVSLDSKTDTEIHLLALAKAAPKVKARVQDKSEEHIAAAFDVAMDSIDEKPPKKAPAPKDESVEEDEEDTSIDDSDGEEDDEEEEIEEEKGTSQDSDDEFTAYRKNAERMAKMNKAVRRKA